MPYDATWARSVYNTYAKLHTRVQQIDTCIQQTLDQEKGGHPLRAVIVSVLVRSIQVNNKQQLWNLYKRLVKRTPLDQELLKKVSVLAYNEIHEIDVEKNQRQFDFS